MSTPSTAAPRRRPVGASDSAAAPESSYYMVGIAVAVVAVIAIIIALFYCRGSGSACATACCPTTCFTPAQISDHVYVPTVATVSTAMTTLPVWETVTASTTATISVVNNGWFRLTFASYASAGAATLVAATSANTPVPGVTDADLHLTAFIKDFTGAVPYWSAHIVSSASGVYDIPLPTGFTLTSSPIYVYLSKH